MQKKFGTIASIYGALAVVLGAFGAHALKDKLDIYQHAIYDKAVSYQFYHAIALLVIALLAKNTSSKSLQFAGRFFTIGILFFYGSLFLLATKQLTGISNFTFILGPITPIGGLCFIAGWISLLIFFRKQ